MTSILRISFLFALFATQASADDWPMWRHDAARSGYTSEALPAELELRWQRQLTHKPRPAWPRSDRMTFDRACPLIAAEGLLFYGDSVDGSIHALDAATGISRWSFPTRAPVRFAPAYWNGRVFATSDDGFLYCLSAKDGSLLWKRRGGPSDELILGNGRMISRWPARGGPVIYDDVLYFAAGIWPSDGVSLYALNPESGDTIWVNDTAGSIYMGQPHGGAFAKSGVAAQGYLVASEEQIFMATGRAVPAAFDRRTGEFQYLALQENTKRGGAEVMLSDRFFINNGYAFEKANGALNGSVGAGPIVVTPNGLVGVFGKEMVGYEWIDKQAVDRKGGDEKVRSLEEQFSVQREQAAFSAIVAEDQIIVGTVDEITIAKIGSSENVWHKEVWGTPYTLAVADKRLFVSTDEGVLYCFGEKADQYVSHTSSETAPDNELIKTAEEIVRRTKIQSGYCLDLGCGDGSLALALAKTTDLFIYGIESDPEKVATARALLTSAGLYGSRVMVLEGDPEDTNLPDFFANLAVSQASLTGELSSAALAEAKRVRRPWGGTLVTGKLGAMKVDERGALEGAGQWTHQYADPANSVNSGDELIRGPLGMLWFSDLEQPMTQRHGRGPAPLFNKGVLYSEGLDGLIAVDAYNGHQLWKYDIPNILTAFDGDHLMGTSGTGSNYCVSDNSVFVRRKDHCLRIDAKTGELIAKFDAPSAKGGGNSIWGYLAHEDGVLFGTLSDPTHVPTYRYRKGGDMNQQLTESKSLFALDTDTGKLRWRYDAKHSIRHNAIAIGNRAVVLIDRAQAVFDRKKNGKANEEEHPTGELVALDSKTGEVLWINKDDIYGTVAAISEEHHSVLMSYQPTSFRLESEVGGRLSMFDLSTGKIKWEANSKYSSRPVINSDTVYAQGGAWDVMTGDTRPFNFMRSYGCGILAGSRDMMVFRSATLGYFDLTRNAETEDFGGIRPGCWINVIPAGGLVFAPDASAGCKCSYLNQSWIALQPSGIRSPKIEAETFSDPKKVTARLVPDSGNPKLRYTLDGSSPTAESALYQSPIEIAESSLLRARAFSDSGRHSPPVDQEILIDPDLLPLSSDLWAAQSGEWVNNKGVIEQISNYGLARKPTLENTPNVERPGCLYVFESDSEFTDGEISFEIRSEDNDALGFVLRYQGADQYYLWAISAERPYRSLALKNGDSYEVLESVKVGYQVRKWHQVRFVLKGTTVTAYFDGEKDFTIDDATFEDGKIGFYSWANSGSRFRNLRFMPAD